MEEQTIDYLVTSIFKSHACSTVQRSRHFHERIEAMNNFKTKASGFRHDVMNGKGYHLTCYWCYGT